jgi:hypothetical protein
MGYYELFFLLHPPLVVKWVIKISSCPHDSADLYGARLQKGWKNLFSLRDTLKNRIESHATISKTKMITLTSILTISSNVKRLPRLRLPRINKSTIPVTSNASINLQSEVHRIRSQYCPLTLIHTSTTAKIRYNETLSSRSFRPFISAAKA